MLKKKRVRNKLEKEIKKKKKLVLSYKKNFGLKIIISSSKQQIKKQIKLMAKTQLSPNNPTHPTIFPSNSLY